jgi:hypothetical protein
MKNLNKNPIIIIGMHRSGTSLLSSILDSMNVHMGNKKDSNNESTFFLKLNTWILQQAGGNWVSKHSEIDDAIKNDRFKKLILNHIQYRLDSLESIEYLGLKRYLNFNKNNLHYWGWKDPRNTLTYDIWNEIYPDSKIISIRRHGLDVAYSLQKRSSEWIEKALLSNKNFQHNIKLRLYGYSDSYKSLNVETSIGVWKNYEEKVEIIKSKHPKILSLKYEDLLLETDMTIEKIQNFLQTRISQKKMTDIKNNFSADKAYSHKKNEKSSIDLKKYKFLLESLGY